MHFYSIHYTFFEENRHRLPNRREEISQKKMGYTKIMNLIISISAPFSTFSYMHVSIE